MRTDVAVTIIVCAVILVVIMFAKSSLECFDVSWPLDEVFNNIYTHQGWGMQGDSSGSGSEPDFTTNTRALLTRLVKERGVRSVVDAPCGACKWTAVWLDELRREGIQITYRGFDIANQALKSARHNLMRAAEYHDVRIEYGDITRTPLPRADLVLCRDVLQHLSYVNIRAALHNLANSGSTAFLIGAYLAGSANRDVADGSMFAVNLTAEPFNMRPDAVFSEGTPMTEDLKYLCMFTDIYKQGLETIRIG
jgi:SAM-dependent methyltransferase